MPSHVDMSPVIVLAPLFSRNLSGLRSAFATLDTLGIGGADPTLNLNGHAVGGMPTSAPIAAGGPTIRLGAAAQNAIPGQVAIPNTGSSVPATPSPADVIGGNAPATAIAGPNLAGTVQELHLPTGVTPATAGTDLGDSANYRIEVGVDQVPPADLRTGGPLFPADARRAALHDADLSGGTGVAKDRADLAKEMQKMHERGEDVPDEMTPETIAERAHQLMQSGDYGDGPPYPLVKPAVPKWRRQGVEEAMEIRTQEKNTLGTGRSAEVIRCFEGDMEVPCPGSGSCKLEVASFEDYVQGWPGLAPAFLKGPLDGGLRCAVTEPALSCVKARRRVQIQSFL